MGKKKFPGTVHTVHLHLYVQSFVSLTESINITGNNICIATKTRAITEICFLSNTFYCYILAEIFPKIHKNPRIPLFIPLVMYDKG
jgi:hypothetical protein